VWANVSVVKSEGAEFPPEVVIGGTAARYLVLVGESEDLQPGALQELQGFWYAGERLKVVGMYEMAGSTDGPVPINEHSLDGRSGRRLGHAILHCNRFRPVSSGLLLFGGEGRLRTWLEMHGRRS
jgi:hypothetical protein